MRLAVIGHTGRVARNRHRHFVRDRRDFQLAFALGDLVVVRLRIAVQHVGELVIARANVRLASRHVVRRAFAISKAVAAYRHLAVRQRRAVVDLLIRSGGQRHFALLDFELAVRRLRNDIFLRPVYLANGLLREFHVILSSIRSRRANGDCTEISAFRRTGKAGNAMLVSIISLRVAVRRQRDVLIIVEIDYVLGRIRANRDRLGFSRSRHRRIALRLGRLYVDCISQRIFIKACRRGNKLFVRTIAPIVVHRVAQVGSLPINDRLSLIFGQRSVHNSPIRRITGDNRRIYRVPCAMV